MRLISLNVVLFDLNTHVSMAKKKIMKMSNDDKAYMSTPLIFSR
jgi:hypothetical protein